MSRKPPVVTKAIRAPRRSRMALVATVEPCTKSVTAAGSIPAAASAPKAPMSGLRGVLGTFTTRTRPSETATRSVKVPPTSMPTRMRPPAPCPGGDAIPLPAGCNADRRRLPPGAGAG